MTRKLSAILIISVFIFAFLAVSAFGMRTTDKQNVKFPSRVQINQSPADQAAEVGVDRGESFSKDAGVQSLGFEESGASLSPGKTIGSTYYDYQHNSRMGRQVEWRGNQMVHFIWMKLASSDPSAFRCTAYDCWDPTQSGGAGALLHYNTSPLGGVNMHSAGRSGYVSEDVMNDSRVVVVNHHSTQNAVIYDTLNATTFWYDYAAGSGNFLGNYISRCPNNLIYYIYDPEGGYEYSWPYVDWQVWSHGGVIDTVTHAVSQQFGGGRGNRYMVYYRRVGSDTAGVWDYPPMLVDTINTVCQTVTSSRTSGKVAIVWEAGYTNPAGQSESFTRDSRSANDLYYMISNDAGDTWGSDVNATKYDSAAGGWLASEGEMSALIGTDDRLHIVWAARSVEPTDGGTFTHFYGCRVLHYDDVSEGVHVVSDANWDIPDSGCTGGAFNWTSLVKLSVSECNNKIYALFAQFNDIFHDIANDCHNRAWTETDQSGSANGELFISVSDNSGRNWDLARNLTNSYTPHCDSTPPKGTLECDADMWPSMARFGMQSTSGFTGVPVVTPEGGNSTNWYLDIFYVNDKDPGGAIQGDGLWVSAPLKWFRVPCVDPIPAPILSITPNEIVDPAWTKLGTEKDTTIKLENIGNAPMSLDAPVVGYVTGATYDWLGITGTPTSITEEPPDNYGTATIQLNKLGNYGKGNNPPRDASAFDGTITFDGDFVGAPLVYKVHLIIADSVQFPQWATIRTAKKRIILNNAGNLGKSGDNDVNMNFFDDCDTTKNSSGNNANAKIYLYDASPFLLRVSGTDTILNSYIFDASWLNNDGFRPRQALTVDSTTHADYQYASTGKFVTRDSVMALECEYFAPTNADSSDFIVQKVRIYSKGKDTDSITGVFVGELMDWDIPSDTSVENKGIMEDPPNDRQALYIEGGDYGLGESENNECIDPATLRMGGFAYYGGWRMRKTGGSYPNYTFTKTDLATCQGMFVGNNEEWTKSGNFPPQKLYDKLATYSGYDVWSSDDPDSEFVDVNMVAAYGKYNLRGLDTLTFISIFATEYDGGLSGIQATIDKAKAWINSRSYLTGRAWQSEIYCCKFAGDANGDWKCDLLDILYLISYKFKSGPAPTCLQHGNVNNDFSGTGAAKVSKVDLLDILYLISYKFKSGPVPTCPAGPKLE